MLLMPQVVKMVKRASIRRIGEGIAPETPAHARLPWSQLPAWQTRTQNLLDVANLIYIFMEFFLFLGILHLPRFALI